MVHAARGSVIRAVLAALMLTLVVSYPARAAVGDYVADGVNIRLTPSFSGTVMGLGYIGQGACVYNDVFGDGVTWRYHTNMTTSVTGYSYRPYVEVTNFYQGC